MRRILGIDPGLRITGYGLVELPVTSFDARFLEAGVLRLNTKFSIEDRLVQLAADLDQLLEEHKPQVLAVEKLYSHYKHPRTAILMAHARGVILLCARRHDVELMHLPATEVKKSTTGHGHASKEQMQRAIQTICRLPEPPSPPDVADAIAIALTCARRLALQRA